MALLKLRKLLDRLLPPAPDIEKLVGALLLHHPQCGKDVLLVSREYGDTDHKCDVVVPAKDLLEFLKSRKYTAHYGASESTAAELAMPIWLQANDDSLELPSRITSAMRGVLKSYLDFGTQERYLKVFCYCCNEYDLHPRIETWHRVKEGLMKWADWTETWTCSKGHQLYYMQDSMHFQISRKHIEREETQINSMEEA